MTTNPGMSGYVGAATVRAALPLVEVALMTTLLLSYIWIWHGRFPGAYALCIALYFGIGFAGHWYRRESLQQIGLRLDNLRPASLDALRVTLPIIVIVGLIGVATGSIAFPPIESWPARLGSGWLWGTMQQYGLTAFFYRRLCEALRSPSMAGVAAAALFALFHLPNAFLTVFTLGAGLLACWLYRRHPNLLVLGAVHALISFVVINSLPGSVTLRLRVGP